MYKLTCKKMGGENCDFVAEGETVEATIGKMKEHTLAAHPLAMKDAEGKEEALTNKMVANMEKT